MALSLACEPMLPHSIPHPARFTHLTGSRCISLQTRSPPTQVGSHFCPSLSPGGSASGEEQCNPRHFLTTV